MTHPADFAPQAGVIGMFGRARADLAEFRGRRARMRQTMHELSSFTDRELNDLGICRADIARIARETK